MKKHFMFNLFIIVALLLGILPVYAASQSPQPAAQSDKTVSLRLSPQAYAAASDLAVRQVIDYGSFVWLEIPASQLPALAARGVAYELGETTLGIYDFKFDPRDGEPLLPDALRAPEEGNAPGLRLVQFAGPISDSWLADISASGLVLLQYYPHHAYLVWGTAAQVNNLEGKSFLRWSGAFHPAYKLDPYLNQFTKGLVENIAVVVYNDGNLERTLETLKGMGNYIQHYLSQADGTFYTVILKLDASRLNDVARLSTVWAVNFSSPRPGFDDENAGQIVAGNYLGGTPVTGYYNWLASKGVNGNGVRWADVDTGLDTTHPDLTGRAVAFVTYAGAPPANTDPDGHGSHTAGAIMGDGRGGVGVINPAAAQDPNNFYWGVGMAPSSTLVVQNALYGDDWPPIGGWNILSRDSVLNGAQGSSNSWYTGYYNNAYTAACREHDLMVRDAVFTTTTTAEPIIYVFSAGNGGPNYSTLSEPHAAKNPIIVGASSNYPRSAASINDMAYFSSRGPTADGRLRPDVTAPGYQTVSFNSSQNDSNPQPSCNTGVAGPGGTYYSYCSGTSMACPLVAGSSALIVDWWRQDNAGVTPSPAMVKALLINGADDQVGGNRQAGSGSALLTNIPNNDVGWGRVNLTNTIRTGVDSFYTDQEHLLANTGETWQKTLNVADPTKPVKISLVWTDAAGAVGANPALVNNLNLTVVNGGNTYLGNVFSGGWSATGGAADTLNNMENVFLPAGANGMLQVMVSAANIAGDGVPYNGDLTDQDFALVIYNVQSPEGLGLLDGIVYDAVGTPATTPIVGAQIMAAGSVVTNTGSATSNASGYYQMGLVTDTYTVTVAAYGYLPAEISGVDVVSGTTTTLNIPLTMAPSAVISGYVTDANTGWGLYASIDTNTPAGSVWTNPLSGYYEVTLPGGVSYTLDVSAWVVGYLPTSTLVIVSGNMQQDFALDADMVACGAPGYTQVGGLVQHFDSTTPPPGWSVVNNGGTCTWQFDNPGLRANLTGGTGNFAIADSDNCGSGTTMSTTLYSPIVDVSAVSVITLSFKYDYNNLSTSEVAAVDVSNNGGSTWTNVVSWNSDQRGPATFSQNITGLVGGSTQAQIRFRYVAPGWDWWWEVDDVMLGLPICNVPTGGLVVGNAYDDNTGDPLNGVGVENEDGYSTASVAAPGPAGAGFYYLYSPAGAGKTFTATLTGYGPAVEAPIVLAGQTIRQDFDLPAPSLAVTPVSLVASVEMGLSVTRPLTISNVGGAPLTFEFAEVDRGFQPALLDQAVRVTMPGIRHSSSPAAKVGPGARDMQPTRDFWIQPDRLSAMTINVLLLTPDSAAGDISLIQNTLAAFPDLVITTWNTADGDPTPAELAPYDVVIVGNDYTWTSSGMTAAGVGNALADYIDLGGKVIDTMFVQSYDAWALAGRYITDGYSAFTPSTQDFNNPPYSLGTIHDPSHPIMNGVTTIVDDPTIGYSHQDVGLATGAVRLADWDDGEIAIACNSNVVGVNQMWYQGSSWTGDVPALMHNAIVWLSGSGDVPWLFENPVSNTIPALNDQLITVTFDAGVPEVTQPGQYYATLLVSNDTPYGAVNIPVTMTVSAPTGWGFLNGTVTGLGYCDVPGAPLEDAVVYVENSGGVTWSVTSNASGYYSLWLPGGGYTVTASMEAGYDAQTVSVVVTGQMTTTQNFDLRLVAPCVNVDPASLSSTQRSDEQMTQTLTIYNDGAGPMNWAVSELAPTCEPNALSWVSVAPTSGVAGPDSNVPLVATFDSTGLPSGVYTGSLCVESNDPINPLIAAPVTMTVQNPPVCSFTSSSPDDLGQTTTFTNTTTGGAPITYRWNLGDNSPLSAATNPTHTYAQVGVYTVILTATNQPDVYDVCTGTVSIEAPPLAGFVSNSSVVLGTPMIFTNTTTANPPVTVWQWNFGDLASGSNNLSNAENPTHTFTAVGNYTVILTATNAKGSDTYTDTVTVTPACVPVSNAAFTWLPMTPTVGALVYFTGTASGTTPIGYSWDFGVLESGANITFTFATTGVHTVVMTATNGCGSMPVTHDVTVTTAQPPEFKLYLPIVMRNS